MSMTIKTQDADTTTTASAATHLKGDYRGTFTIESSITGAPTAVVIDIEGSLDGTNYTVIGTNTFSAGELTATYAMFHVSLKPVKFVRTITSTLTAGTAPTVTTHVLAN